MIVAKKVQAFFDRLAPQWDATTERNDAIIERILDAAGVRAGADVLDVACGTGVLIPDYLGRGVASVTAVDLSPKMTEIAAEKFAGEPNVAVLCADACTARFDRLFDCIVIYNAFPHFAQPDALIAALSDALKPGGRLTVAHDRSREAINAHHKGMPDTLAADLMSADALAAIFERTLTVLSAVSDEHMYLVVGTKA